MRRRLLVEHHEVNVRPAEPESAALVIQPEKFPFISYPFEWSQGQLRAAAEATLEIQRIALEHGMTLRDASAYNIQFHNGRPTLIDTLSFEKHIAGTHGWRTVSFAATFLLRLP